MPISSTRFGAIVQVRSQCPAEANALFEQLESRLHDKRVKHLSQPHPEWDATTNPAQPEWSRTVLTNGDTVAFLRYAKGELGVSAKHLNPNAKGWDAQQPLHAAIQTYVDLQGTAGRFQAPFEPQDARKRPVVTVRSAGELEGKLKVALTLPEKAVALVHQVKNKLEAMAKP